ncbi:glycosyltransferase [Limosilactobacillus reuteri]|jgi:GT2 family glycosyltransferase|uniref:glycosyltransferase n=1 Tax=Limosilactobacillus reuteri TaxID=1598 RepID=UPI000A2E58BE|nr:glycosyltransferase [Limosilactobacillus reuteri]OTA48787.1 hypothetical protein BHL90_08890 [Limosilactobacillus reuteri]
MSTLSSKKESEKIKISVGIVFYNPTSENIRQTFFNIKQLSSINIFDLSFYLIDNASTDRVLQKMIPQKLDKNVHCIKLIKNNGFGYGHNSIIDKLNSDYHIIMNPDIELKDIRGFTEAISYMQHHDNVALLSPLVRNQSDGEIQLLNRREPTVFDLFIRFFGPNIFPKRQSYFVKSKHGYDHIQSDENATGSFMMVRTAIFKEIGGFDTRFFMYFEDTDLTKRISTKGKVVFFPYLTVIHGWKRDNHSIKGIASMIKSMIIYFNKWGWRWI